MVPDPTGAATAADNPAPPARRLTQQERREQVLRAAIAVVAASGFAGATTDAVARAAGVSQPYVVRMFGGRHELLTALFQRVARQVGDTFSAVPAGPDAVAEMGDAYQLLVADRDLLSVLLQGFAASADPVIGATARTVLGDIVRIYRARTGAGTFEAMNFLAQGMLINTLLVVRAPEHLGQDRDLDAMTHALVDVARVDGGAGGPRPT